MRRGGGLVRRTPLVARSVLARTPMARARSAPASAREVSPKPRRDTGPSPATRRALAIRSAGLCELCGLVRAEQAHHRRPRAAGGSRRPDTNGLANLLALCSPCHHDQVESFRSRALVHGWLLSQDSHPTRVPVLLHTGWVRLDDEGGTTPHDRTEETR